MAFEYSLTERIGLKATFGLVVLMSDETLEHDMRRMMPLDDVALYVTRIFCNTDVNGDTLGQMERLLPESVKLFPPSMPFDCIGYGCTSGASIIGSDVVGRIIQSNAMSPNVTDPIRALVAACEHLNIKKLAFLTPYIRDVSETMMGVLNTQGIETPLFGSFEESNDQRVARINPQSTFDAAVSLAENQDCDGLFMSCTNLRTLDVIPKLEDRLGIPALSSNQVLAWHMAQNASIPLNKGFGQLIDS